MNKVTPVMAYPCNRVKTVSDTLRPIYVAVLSTERCYGGPEEGGWWYDWTTVEEIQRCWSPLTAIKAARQFKEGYPTCPRGRGSVLGGDDIRIFVSYELEMLESCETTERPTYC